MIISFQAIDTSSNLKPGFNFYYYFKVFICVIIIMEIANENGKNGYWCLFLNDHFKLLNTKTDQ